jgi:DNA-binding MarR family transcriptional regulator
MAALSLDQCLGPSSPGRLLRRINRLVQQRIEPGFAHVHLTFVQWMALMLIFDGVVANAGELSRDVGITTGATTRLIDGLEHRGLCRRERVSGDRRVVLLKLTDAGRARYLEQVPAMLATWNELLADFDDSEVQQLIRLLFKLSGSFERRGVEGAQTAATARGTLSLG